MKTKISLGIVVLLILIQFIPIKKNEDTNNEFDIINTSSASEEVATILKTSCYDCHSNATNYPWYSKIAPVNFMLARHIKEGKEHVNFSEWKYYDGNKQIKMAEESIEMLEKGEMPLSSYTLIHKEAILNGAQKAVLIDFFKGI
jgi:hypothetical protein